MSIQGIIIINIMCLILIATIINFVRINKLNVGFAVIWLVAILFLMVIISVPAFLVHLPEMLGAIYPASALTLLAFVFIFLILIFFSIKLSQISERQVKIAQMLALYLIDNGKNIQE